MLDSRRVLCHREPVELSDVLTDLRAQYDELDDLVGGLSADRWATDTPAAGWTIAHQVAHLAWTEEQALLAATDGPRFQAELAARVAKGGLDRVIDGAAADGAALPPAELLATWRTGRAALADALAAVPPGVKLPWFGPPMSATSMVTARIMETWAHTQDVADALGVTREPADRIRHVAHLGVRTRDFAYAVHGRQAPADPFLVELIGPSGAVWTWGPADAEQRVSGPALDFCLLVTQRVHRDATALRSVGPDAEDWLRIAQAFAGPPGDGRASS